MQAADINGLCRRNQADRCVGSADPHSCCDDLGNPMAEHRLSPRYGAFGVDRSGGRRQALVAVVVAAAAFAPFVILNATHFSFSDGRYGGPIVLFAEGLLKLALVSRSGKDRYRRGRHGLRDE